MGDLFLAMLGAASDIYSVWSHHPVHRPVVNKRNRNIRTQEEEQSSFIHSKASITCQALLQSVGSHWRISPLEGSRGLVVCYFITSFLSELC